MTGAARFRALDRYLDAVFALGAVRLDVAYYGELLADDPHRGPRGHSFWPPACAPAFADAPRHVRADLPELDQVADAFCAEAAGLDVSSTQLVHGDYFPGNVIVDEVGTVLGIVDFANLTMAGDPALDVAGAVAFLRITPGLNDADLRATRTNGPPTRHRARCSATSSASAFTHSGTCTRARTIPSCTAGACRPFEPPAPPGRDYSTSEPVGLPPRRSHIRGLTCELAR